jgi:hypothetical protein
VQITTANYVSINVHGGAGRDTLIDGDALTGPGVRLTSFERFTDS